MHIVFVCREYPPSLRMGGIAAYLKETAENLVQLGHQVEIICASDDTRCHSESTINGVHIIRIEGGDFIIPGIEDKNSRFYKLRILYRFFSYRKRIKEEILKLKHVDIIEVPEFGAEAYYLLDLPIPIVLRLHTPTLLDRKNCTKKAFQLSKFYEYFVGLKELKILKKAKYITSCSKSLANWCTEFVPESKGKIQVIYNSINIDKWTRNSNNLYQEDSILFVGTVAEEKGVGDLVNACQILHEGNHIVNLTIVGKLGSYALNLQDYCKRKKLSWCKFTGHVSRDQLQNLYSTHKVSVFPSWWEAYGLVCVEALACGNIVIGSKSGGMKEIIDDGIEGFLIPPKQPNVLSETIMKALCMSHKEIEDIRKKAHKRITDQFSTEEINKQLVNYYLTVIYEFKKNTLG